MEVFLAPNIVGLIIQGIFSIIVAAIAYVAGPAVVKRLQRRRPSPSRRAQPSKLLHAIVGGISATVTFIVLGLLFNILTPKPSVVITTPLVDQHIEVSVLSNTGAGSFMVSGSSTEVFANPNLRVYVLIHPTDPFASGWWIQQPATVDRNGRWTTQAWYGASQFPSQVGNKIDILALVTTPDSVAGRTQISDPKDISPAAQSDVVRVAIGSIK